MSAPNTVIPTGKFIAIIDENRCIGCTLCIKACPFDAIIGTSKHMHTVITHFCTGCELCLPPCPVDCISLEQNTIFETISSKSSKQEIRELKKSFAILARKNNKRRTLRIEKIEKEKQAIFESRKKELLKR